MDQSYDDQEIDYGRHCIDANASRFLIELSSLDRTFQTKVLITSRMVINDLEDRTGHLLAGCAKKDLMPLSSSEAVIFMRNQGVIKGLDQDKLDVCATYGFHPLTLRLLSSMIAEDKSRPGDISAAPKYDKKVCSDLKLRRHHILETSYQSLPESQQTLLSRISAFRSSISYDDLIFISDNLDSREFDKNLEQLIKRGLLLFDKDKVIYDMHPIVRRYAYENLKEREMIHKKLKDYYKLPAIPKSLDSIEDMMPIIELYYHTAKSGMYEEAARLYVRFSEYLQFRFCAFYSGIRLIKLLFSNDDKIPHLENDALRTYILNEYAMLHARLGQSQIAIDYYNYALKYAYNLNDKRNYFRTLGNLAIQQIYRGEFRNAEMNLRKSVKVQNNDRGTLGRLYSYMGQFSRSSQELRKAINLNNECNLICNNYIHDCHAAWINLLMKKPCDAYSAVIEARKLFESFADGNNLVEIPNTEIEWLLSESLLNISLEENNNQMLDEIEPHLNSAFTRCRRFSLIFFEPGIMLTMARYHLARGDAFQAAERAKDALFLADRCQYRLYQAEIHIFLAHIAMERRNYEDVRQHAEIAYKKAFCDGLKHCYKPALDEAATLLQNLGVKPPKLK